MSDPRGTAREGAGSELGGTEDWPGATGTGGATARLARLPPSVRAGVVAAVALFVCVAAFHAMTLPWTGSLDSPYHLDYVHEVSRGGLPEPIGGDRYRHPDSRVAPNPQQPQYAATHPPGFYLLLAPVVGPLLAGDHYAAGVAAGRAINIAIGALGVLVLAAVGWLVGGPHRAMLAIVLPSITALFVAFVRPAGDIYNDVATAVASIATLGVCIVVLRDGISTRRVLGLAALAAIGMGLKATFVFTLAAACGVVVLASLIHRRDRLSDAIRRSTVALAAILAAPLVAVGWFYYRNHTLSGSWYKARESQNLQNRTVRDLDDVLGDLDFWSIVPTDLLGNATWQLGPITNQTASALLTLGGLATLVVVGLMIAVRHRRSGAGWFETKSLTIGATVALLGGHLVLLYGAQLRHAVGTGQYSIRYFLPALLTVGIVPALALVRFGRWAWTAVAVVLGVELLGSMVIASHYAERRWPELTDGRGIFDQFRSLADANGLPELAPLAALAGAGVAAVVVVLSVRTASVEDHEMT